MSLKTRLQRVLQIVEEAERTGALSDLERDIILAELREAYSEVKFNLNEIRDTRYESEVVVPVTPVVPEAPQPEVEEDELDDEPLMDEDMGDAIDMEDIVGEDISADPNVDYNERAEEAEMIGASQLNLF